MRLHVLRQMRYLHELLVALTALIWEYAVRFHVLRQMRLLFKRFVRALGTGKAADAAVHE